MTKYSLLQVLLRNGADPELRDEDGKTPADKARERHDEGHREVLEILQSPGKESLYNFCFSCARTRYL